MAQRNCECPTCFETYDSEDHRPLNLLCGHVFCRECTSTLKIAESGRQFRIKCPTCRTEKTYSEELSTNFTMLELIEQAGMQRSCTECMQATDKKSLAVCTTCISALICAMCMLRNHSGHSFLSYADQSPKQAIPAPAATSAKKKAAEPVQKTNATPVKPAPAENSEAVQKLLDQIAQLTKKVEQMPAKGTTPPEGEKRPIYFDFDRGRVIFELDFKNCPTISNFFYSMVARRPIKGAKGDVVLTYESRFSDGNHIMKCDYPAGYQQSDDVSKKMDVMSWWGLKWNGETHNSTKIGITRYQYGDMFGRVVSGEHVLCQKDDNRFNLRGYGVLGVNEQIPPRVKPAPIRSEQRPVYLDFDRGRIVVELDFKDCPTISKLFYSAFAKKPVEGTSKIASISYFMRNYFHNHILTCDHSVGYRQSNDKRKNLDLKSWWGLTWNGDDGGQTKFLLTPDPSNDFLFGKVLSGAEILGKDKGEHFTLRGYGIVECL